MERIDLYALVHKGLRAELFETATEVARTEFAGAAGAEPTLRRVRCLLGFLDEHARHEDSHIMPLVAAQAPRLAAEIAAEHLRVEAAHQGLGALLERLERAPLELRAGLARQLHEELTLLVALHVAHMQREESEVNRALWAGHDDALLGAAHAAILADIAPQRLAQWLELMLPAMHAGERAELIGGLHAKMPREAFERLLAPARHRLGESAWSKCAARAAIPAEHVRFVASAALERAS
ncbi:MAG: hemerythrin domain-containing protein [Planctomycetes bacterium]|nr:hemerythrin domain-containing protein [Planctomycetota bacterium]